MLVYNVILSVVNPLPHGSLSNGVNKMPADGLAPDIARPSAGFILTICGNKYLVFPYGEFL